LESTTNVPDIEKVGSWFFNVMNDVIITSNTEEASCNFHFAKTFYNQNRSVKHSISYKVHTDPDCTS